MVASHVPPTGDLACNPGMCPDWELNQQPFGLQAGAQNTPGRSFYILKVYFNEVKASVFFSFVVSFTKSSPKSR